MKLGETRTITMMDLRHHIGEVVNDISYTNTRYVVEKHGKPICVIQPCETIEKPTVEADQQVARIARINRLFGALKHIKVEPEDWTKEYEEVDKAYDKKIQDAWNGK